MGVVSAVEVALPYAVVAAAVVEHAALLWFGEAALGGAVWLGVVSSRV